MVSGFNHLEKYSSMGRIIPYIMETKKCSKPPISNRCLVDLDVCGCLGNRCLIFYMKSTKFLAFFTGYSGCPRFAKPRIAGGSDNPKKYPVHHHKMVNVIPRFVAYPLVN